MDEKKFEIELIDYQCAECGGADWKLQIGHCEDGRTMLYTVCASDDCISAKRHQLGIPEDEQAFIFWDEFDVTGQGHDYDDHHGDSCPGRGQRILN